MTLQEFKKYYRESLQRGYRNAKADDAVESFETLEVWAEGEYEIYLADPEGYEVAYCGLFDD